MNANKHTVINKIFTVIEIAVENVPREISTNKNIERKQNDIQKNDLINIFTPFFEYLADKIGLSIVTNKYELMKQIQCIRVI